MPPLTLVLVRRRGAWEAFRAWLARRRPVVHQSSAPGRVGPRGEATRG